MAALRLGGTRLIVTVDLSIIIVSWNARHHLERCLTSLSSTSARRSLEIIVVDSESQ